MSSTLFTGPSRAGHRRDDLTLVAAYNATLCSTGEWLMDDELVVVYEGGGGLANAQMIRSVLEADGIEAGIRSDSVSMYPVNVGYLAEFAILVRRSDAERAAELLKGLLEGDAELEEGEEPE